jgi:hypothetical protein
MWFAALALQTLLHGGQRFLQQTKWIILRMPGSVYISKSCRSGPFPDFFLHVAPRPNRDSGLQVQPDSSDRFRVEILFSNGANYQANDETQLLCTAPRIPFHRNSHLRLSDFQAHMSRWGGDGPWQANNTQHPFVLL